MADETLGLEIKYTLDTSELIAGSQEANAALQETASVMENTGQTFKDGADDIEQAVDEMADEVQEKAKEAGDALAETGKKARQAGQETGDGASKGIKGLDELKDSAGETSSSLGAMGGAISVVNPQMGAMVSNAGALSGGLEGAAKMTGGFRAAIGALSSPVGLVAVGVLAAGAALFAWSKRAKAAAVDNSELEGSLKALADAQVTFLNTADQLAILEGKTTQYRAELSRLGDTIEREFADKLQEVNDPFVEFVDDVKEANTAYRDFVNSPSWKNMGTNMQMTRLEQRKLMEREQELQKARLEALRAMDAAHAADTKAAKARRELIAGIEQEEQNRRKILLIRAQQEEQAEIQSKLLDAQAKNDRAAIRSVSMEMAKQADVLLTNQIQAVKWAAATQIAFVKASGVATTATVAMIAAINAQTDAMISNMKTEASFETIHQRNLAGMEERTRSTIDATAAQTDLDSALARGADLLAQARGELAVINKEHADSLTEIEQLTKQGAITEDEAAELVTAANDKKKAATQDYMDAKHAELQETHDLHRASVALAVSETDQLRDEYAAQLAAAQEAYDQGFASKEEFTAKKLELDEEYRRKKGAIDAAQLQSDLANAQMVTDQIGTLMDAAIAQRSEQIDREEAAALARAAGNMEEQEKIRQKFEDKRRSEMAKAFRARQALEISNAIISGASATIAALAPPPIGPGPLLGPLMAGMIAATTAIQVATISQQKPSFHQGGIVGGDGDQMITAQGGEVVLNRNAVAELGGTSAANSLNSGGAAGGVVVVQMTYRNKMFDQLVVDNLAKGGPLKKALGRATRRGRRGRVGGRL